MTNSVTATALPVADLTNLALAASGSTMPRNKSPEPD